MSRYPLAINRLTEKYPEARILKINEEVTAYEFGKYKTRIDSHPSEGGVFGFIITEDKRLVLIKRADSNIWALPGGTVELGEDFDSAFIREVSEECGIEIVIDQVCEIQEKTVISPSKKTLTFWICVFLSHPTSKQPPRVTDQAKDECLEIDTFGYENMPSRILSSNKEIIKKYYRRKH